MQKDLKKYALTLLSRREYAEKTFISKLLEKGFLRSDIENITLMFKEKGYLSDERFAETLTRSRRGKGYGPIRIAMELKSLGIADETIADHVNITDNAWFNDAQRLWQKHFKGKLPITLKDRMKQIRYLKFRGFSNNHINSIFKDYDEE